MVIYPQDPNSSKKCASNPYENLMLVSFKLMRLWVGILGISIGILLPLITLLFSSCGILQESISHYYYTVAGDVFVGLLCAVAFFLIIYPGEGRWEDLWTNIAGICALGVAFFPTSYNQANNACTKFSFCHDAWVSKVHLICAGLFFIILGGVAIFQFSKIKAPLSIEKKKKRKIFYITCGIIMWISIGTLVPMAFSEIHKDYLSKHKIVYFVEVIALLSFGSCWLIKGYERQLETLEIKVV